jgi:hypothetical protein
MAQKIQFVVCVLHKPKLLILTSLFWFWPNANTRNSLWETRVRRSFFYAPWKVWKSFVIISP